jgi:hypothetical protein
LYLLPKLLFPLMAMTFTETQCAQIQSQALRALLPKLHLNWNTAWSIIHGPSLYGGMNIPHLYTSQGLHQLKFLLGHLRAHDKTGRLLLNSHGSLQILVGVSENFLNTSYKKHCHLACPSWFTSVWLFLSKLQFTVFIKHAWLPPTPTTADVNLMDYFISIGSSPKLLVSLNRCRVFLQLLLFSDMVSADGRNLVHQVLQGHKLTDKRSLLRWPEQHNPSKADRCTWEKALSHLAPNGRLVQPIDMSNVVSHQRYFWYMDSHQSPFHNVNDDQWNTQLIACTSPTAPVYPVNVRQIASNKVWIVARSPTGVVLCGHN